MRKNILFSMLTSFLIPLSFLSTAQAQEIPVAPILGHWVAQEPLPAPGVQYYLSFDFSPTQTQLQVNCVFGVYASLTAQAVARTDYQATYIYIQERNEGIVNDGVRYCRATLMPARWEALFDGTGNMILFIPTPYQARLTLVREQSPVPLR